MKSTERSEASIDYSIVDRPEILQLLFYPRKDWEPPPSHVVDYVIPVDEDVSVSCRFYSCNSDAPTILYFHGNGEIASDYNWTAPAYTSVGINLFVADYRGYGSSTGSPTFFNMIKDANTIFDFFQKLLHSEGYSKDVYVMGRSLGSHSAVEILSHNQDQIRGLILESGFADISRLLSRLSNLEDSSRLEEIESAHMAKIRAITLPVLIIHGDCDELVPPAQAFHFHENVGAEDKRLVTISGAGHNDIMAVGQEQYFQAIKDFLFPLR